MNCKINLTEEDRIHLIKQEINTRIIAWARENHADQIKRITQETLKQLDKT